MEKELRLLKVSVEKTLPASQTDQDLLLILILFPIRITIRYWPSVPLLFYFLLRMLEPVPTKLDFSTFLLGIDLFIRFILYEVDRFGKSYYNFRLYYRSPVPFFR